VKLRTHFHNLPQTPALLKTSHLPSLDGWRGVAILLVVIEHAWHDIFWPFHGNYGVYIFFGISGFLITTLLLKEKVNTGTISLRMFYIRRFLRIFPVAYLYLLVVLILNFVFNLDMPPGAFISSALYLQNTTAFDNTSIYIRHYWSLATEEQFYLIFPAIIKVNAKFYVLLVAVLVFIIPVIAYLDISGRITSPIFHFVNEILRYMPALLIASGVSILMFYGVIEVPAKIPGRSLIVLILFLSAGYLISQPMTLRSTSLSFTVAYMLISAMLVVSLATSDDVVFRILNSKMLSTIGIYSYSLYVWQQLFTEAMPWAHLFPGSGSHLLNFLALTAITYASYNFYEKRFLTLKDRFR
jgi:peptidoglycan/LPS O-acetylase OafA/YrhL